MCSWQVFLPHTAPRPHTFPHLITLLHGDAQGALELQRTSAGARQELSEDDKQRLWLKQAPWMTGHLNPR